MVKLEPWSTCLGGWGRGGGHVVGVEVGEGRRVRGGAMEQWGAQQSPHQTPVIITFRMVKQASCPARVGLGLSVSVPSLFSSSTALLTTSTPANDPRIAYTPQNVQWESKRPCFHTHTHTSAYTRAHTHKNKNTQIREA